MNIVKVTEDGEKQIEMKNLISFDIIKTATGKKLKVVGWIRDRKLKEYVLLTSNINNSKDSILTLKTYHNNRYDYQHITNEYPKNGMV